MDAWEFVKVETIVVAEVEVNDDVDVEIIILDDVLVDCWVNPEEDCDVDSVDTVVTMLVVIRDTTVVVSTAVVVAMAVVTTVPLVLEPSCLFAKATKLLAASAFSSCTADIAVLSS